MEEVNKLKLAKFFLSIFTILTIFIVIFLSVNLVKYYNKYIKVKKNTDLVYVFDSSNSSHIEPITSDLDTGESYLSYKESYGIDVSEWQGNIDWMRVKNSGISFAMIRCGFREYVGGLIHEDAKFRENMEGAINAGLIVGVYFYGGARNNEEALEEAEFTYNLIKDYTLTYPVAYDIEAFTEGRLTGANKSIVSDSVVTYTETLASYGYQTMVYSYKTAFTDILDTGKFDGMLIWLAHFAESTDYHGNYNMWQYSEEGRVDGILTAVDLNISYFTYVQDENGIVENPNYIYPPIVEFTNISDEVKTIKNATIRNSATTDLPNRLGTIKRGTVLKRVGISEKFSKVIYDGKMVFIENKTITTYTP